MSLTEKVLKAMFHCNFKFIPEYDCAKENITLLWRSMLNKIHIFSVSAKCSKNDSVDTLETKQVLCVFCVLAKPVVTIFLLYARALVIGILERCQIPYTLIQNGKYPAIIIFDDRMLRYVIAAYQWTS